MTFTLQPNLAPKTVICKLELCTILLHEVKDCPWIFLVPQRENVSLITDLSRDDQYTLVDEIDHCSRVMKRLFTPDHINVAAIGNITPQLHVHIICRYTSDPHWPDVCWNKPLTDMSTDECKHRAHILHHALKQNPIKG